MKFVSPAFAFAFRMIAILVAFAFLCGPFYCQAYPPNRPQIKTNFTPNSGTQFTWSVPDTNVYGRTFIRPPIRVFSKDCVCSGLCTCGCNTGELCKCSNTYNTPQAIPIDAITHPSVSVVPMQGISPSFTLQMPQLNSSMPGSFMTRGYTASGCSSGG